MDIFEATLALLAAALLLSWIAGRLDIPYPSFLVLGGLVLGLIPAVPGIELDPDLAFALFLPPILFEAAYYTSWREFRANGRAIAGLAVILVGITTWVVAIVADRLIPELPIGAAFVLGAIVSPPDAAAATAVLQRMRLPRRVVTIVEGESLANDAVALVIYNFAVESVVTGRFSPSAAAFALATNVVGGLALGLFIGWSWSKLVERLHDPLVGIAASFLVAFGAYLVAEQLGISGVLTVVAAGLFFAWRAPSVLTADSRLSSAAVWQLAIFILNALAFILIGLQLPEIVADLPGYSLITLGEDAAVIAGTVILVRLAWVIGASQLLRWFNSPDQRAEILDWREALIVGWSGMRGLVSLAAALALPNTIADGSPFPARALILFLSFSVILATLLVQGLSLSLLIRLVRLRNDGAADQEEKLARVESTCAAISAIDKLAETPALPRDLLDGLRLVYIGRLQQWSGDGDASAGNPSNGDFLDAVRLAAISAERDTLLGMRRRLLIGDDTLRKIQRELDLTESAIKRRQPAYSQATWLDLAKRSEAAGEAQARTQPQTLAEAR